MTNAIKTFPVSAGAYRNSDYRSCLTHACETTPELDGGSHFPSAVLCKRVKLDSILADATQASDDAPTCPACLKALAKRAK